MKTLVSRLLIGGAGLLGLGGAAYAYFGYSPAPADPGLSGRFVSGAISAGGRQRTYLLYVPKKLPKGAPLVVALPGSLQNAQKMRTWTGYGFDRLADQHSFALIYLDGFEGYWNACNRVGDYAANKLEIDDVGFIVKAVDETVQQVGVDPAKVFAVGISRGGGMALRLALEAPSRFRAVAAVAASLPDGDNYKCAPKEGASSVLIMNGTKDPLNPFLGGDVKLYGLLVNRGHVMSSIDSAKFFAERAKITSQPQVTVIPKANGAALRRTTWLGSENNEVELDAIQGGGHGIPQQYWRAPRFLGPTVSDIDGPGLVWDFFARQSYRPVPNPPGAEEPRAALPTE